MTEKTMKQIEGIRNGRFGVEIEMYNITREKAAKTAAAFFGTGRYENTAARGYRSWTAYDQQGRAWVFAYDCSIQARNDLEKCELITPLLTFKDDIELLQELVRQLRHAKGLSDPEHMNGVHIHIHEEGHTPETLRSLANLMAANEDLISKAVNLDSRREARYCRTVDPDFLGRLNRRKPKTMEALEDCWYGGSTNRRAHYHPSRYAQLNYHSLFQGKGIEFREWQFEGPTAEKRGGLNAGHLKAQIQFCLGLSELAKNIRYASPKKGQRENSSYQMRCFLLRLGFIGDEFKTARNYFMRNFEKGQSAWRHEAA